VSVPPKIFSIQCDHGLRRQAIAESVLKEIVQGQLRPGQHLVAQALARRFGVSLTPIREALIALAGIGVVDLLPNRGAVVRRLTPRDVREICQVRRILECRAVRAACGRIARDELQGLHDEIRRLVAVQPPAPPRFIVEARALDSRLHDAIARSCGNGLLAREIGRLTILFRAFRDMAWEHEAARNDDRRLAGEAHEHLAIVEALLAGDRRQASRAMAGHIRSGMRYWCRALPETPASAPTVRTRSRVREGGES
jgi:DNA-binding GntR family transcriptional regulator